MARDSYGRLIVASRIVAVLFGAASTVMWLTRADSFTSLVVVLGLPLAYFAGFSWALRRVPVTFLIRDRTFVMPRGRPMYGALFVLQAPLLAGFVSSRERDVSPGMQGLLLATVLLGAVLWLFTLFGVGSVRLTPDGVRLSRREFVLWDALVPGGPYEEHVRERSIWLLISPGPTWVSLKLADGLADANFVARAIRYYRDNPDARSSIGTAKALSDTPF